MANTVKMEKMASTRNGRVRKSFSENEFTEDWAEGRLSQRDMAAKYGLSLSMVKKITSGQRRPRIMERVAAAQADAQQRAQRRLTRLMDKAVWFLEHALDAGPTMVALSAAREVLRRGLDAPKAAEAAAAKKAPERPTRPTGPRVLTASPETTERTRKEFGRDFDDDDIVPPRAAPVAGHAPGRSGSPSGGCVPPPGGTQWPSDDKGF